MDRVKRPGPEAMAVDEFLLETATEPLLRVYEWDGDWASVGYFGRISEARTVLSGVSWVRRWTGGGMVDHRADWTYTLVVPHPEPLANARGAESYRQVHTALAAALAAEGTDVRLSGGDGETGAALCFENPVHHDLVGADGRKLAGAGQRRTRLGLLHQGSAASPCDAAVSQMRAERLAAALAVRWEPRLIFIDEEKIARSVTARYARENWTERR
jgi:lipoate-protein ligase A